VLPVLWDECGVIQSEFESSRRGLSWAGVPLPKVVSTIVRDYVSEGELSLESWDSACFREAVCIREGNNLRHHRIYSTYWWHHPST
jgi:hypothetical protein